MNQLRCCFVSGTLNPLAREIWSNASSASSPEWTSTAPETIPDRPIPARQWTTVFVPDSTSLKIRNVNRAKSPKELGRPRSHMGYETYFIPFFSHSWLSSFSSLYMDSSSSKSDMTRWTPNAEIFANASSIHSPVTGAGMTAGNPFSMRAATEMFGSNAIIYRTGTDGSQPVAWASSPCPSADEATVSGQRSIAGNPACCPPTASARCRCHVWALCLCFIASRFVA